MKALIDGDLAVYRACAAQQSTIDFYDGHGPQIIYDVDEATRAAIKLIRNWTKASGASSCVVVFSSPVNFRKVIEPSYKSNRDPEARPKALSEVRKRIEAEMPCWEMYGLEADDVMGMAGSRDPKLFVVVSADKDMATLPATIFNPDKDHRPRTIPLTLADRQWMIQSMTGDTTDGYAGIPKVGPANAAAIYDKPRLTVKRSKGTFVKGPKAGMSKGDEWVDGSPCSVWEAMVSHAKRRGLTEDQLILQVRLARILRAGDYNPETRTVKLWHPRGHEDLHLAEQ